MKKIRRCEGLESRSLWLERNVPEFAPKATPAQTTVANNKGIIMDAETCKALSDAYDARHGKRVSGNTGREGDP